MCLSAVVETAVVASDEQGSEAHLAVYNRLRDLILRLVLAFSEDNAASLKTRGSATWKRRELRRGLEAAKPVAAAAEAEATKRKATVAIVVVE